ncbi:MAG: AMP-binding protein [Rhodanobacteraceae bacterium]|nr:AMP-binding protein [Rhodanobacteraceae bacterium]
MLLAEIARLLAELHPDAPPTAVRLDARLGRDLGLDSLTRIELLARLENRFHALLPEQQGLAAETPADLLRAFTQARPREAPITLAPPAVPGPMTLDPPLEAHTLADVLAWHATRRPAQLHVRFEGGEADGHELTFGALRAAALAIAGGLQRLGITPGAPVALMQPTHPDFLAAFFGVLLGGGVPVPLYPPLRPGELGEFWRRQAGILRNCEARVLVTSPAVHAHRHLVRGLTGPVEHVVTVAELTHGGDALAEPAVLAADALALLQYTSGSTADPKGVMLTHAHLLANIRAMGAAVRIEAGDRFVSWLPLYHDMGLIGAWLGSLYFGTPLVLMPPQTFLLRPQRWLWAIHRYEATMSAAPNFAFELCTHRIADADLDGLRLDRLRLAFCGAEPIFAQTLVGFHARMARYGLRREALFPVYGLAESALALTFPPLDRGPRVLAVARDRFLERGEAAPASGTQAALEFVSCGAPLPGYQVRIVDAGDHELPDGRQGGVQFQGPSACLGYYHADAASARLRHGAWLDTGDLGFVHAGELYLTGRVKDLIIRAGRHIHPQAIEAAVGDLAGVRRGRVAVFGSHAPREGTERLVVVAETRLADAAARAALAARINAVCDASAGAPADEVVLAAPGTVLKTSSGKLRRAACREAWEGGRLGAPDRYHLPRVLLRGALENARHRLQRLRAAAFAGWAWTLLGLLALPAALAVLGLPTLGARWRAVRGLLELLRRGLAVPLAIERAALPAGPCIFVANHASYLDALLLVRVLPRPVAFMAKAELARFALLGLLLRRLGAVFVDRFDSERAIAAVQRAAAGGDVLFFPEGTLRRMPGLLPFHLGAFMAAHQAGRAVVPVALRGTRAALRDGDWFPRHVPLAATFGPAIPTHADLDTWHDALRLSADARAFLLEHSGEPDAREAGFVLSEG